MNYVPNPTRFDDRELPEEILQRLETVAKEVHEMWAQNRIQDGWQYGEEYDGVRKRHPCLIPYEQLPESEKEYDRKTAQHTIQLLLRAGFRITLEKSENEE